MSIAWLDGSRLRRSADSCGIRSCLCACALSRGGVAGSGADASLALEIWSSSPSTRCEPITWARTDMPARRRRSSTRSRVRAIAFEHAYAAAPITLPSHATLMTGRYPPGHGARDNGMQVSKTVPTMATELKAHGFRTAAFVAAFPLDHQFGLDRGFDVYSDRLPRGPDGKPSNERPASQVVDEAIAWLRSWRPLPLQPPTAAPCQLAPAPSPQPRQVLPVGPRLRAARALWRRVGSPTGARSVRSGNRRRQSRADAAARGNRRQGYARDRRGRPRRGLRRARRVQPQHLHLRHHAAGAARDARPRHQLW